MRRTLSLALGATLLLAACKDRGMPIPTEPAANPSTTSFQPHPGVDTSTTPGFPSAVTIQGVVYRTGSGIPTDTGVVSTRPPVPGVTVRFLRNLLVNGQATQQELGRVTSGAQGEFGLSGLPGGYYVVEGLDANGAVINYQLVATTAPVTSTSIWVP